MQPYQGGEAAWDFRIKVYISSLVSTSPIFAVMKFHILEAASPEETTLK
jgi:hypothetical protein